MFRDAIAGPYGNYMFSSIKTAKLSSGVVVPCLDFHRRCMRVPLSPTSSSAAFGVIVISYFSHSNKKKAEH